MPAAWVTAIAGFGVVLVVPHFVVVIVYFAAVIMLVAVDAAKTLEITGDRMAFGASPPLTPMRAAVDREPLLVVILHKRGVPVVGRMTYLAIARESRIPVIRITDAVEVIGMTGVTISGRPGEAAVDMARSAVHLSVRSRQWKIRLVVVDLRRRPTVEAMADNAIPVVVPG